MLDGRFEQMEQQVAALGLAWRMGDFSAAARAAIAVSFWAKSLGAEAQARRFAEEEPEDHGLVRVTAQPVAAPERIWMSTAEAVAAGYFSSETVAKRLRAQSQGPPYSKGTGRNGRVHYRTVDLQAWRNRQRRRTLDLVG